MSPRAIDELLIFFPMKEEQIFVIFRNSYVPGILFFRKYFNLFCPETFLHLHHDNAIVDWVFGFGSNFGILASGRFICANLWAGSSQFQSTSR